VAIHVDTREIHGIISVQVVPALLRSGNVAVVQHLIVNPALCKIKVTLLELAQGYAEANKCQEIYTFSPSESTLFYVEEGYECSEYVMRKRIRV